MEKRLIDANALKLTMYTNKTEDEFVQGYREGKADAILEVMALAPTVDAVEVVRCKDCKHNKDGFCVGYHAQHDIMPDDFCSYGERKSDGK